MPRVLNPHPFEPTGRGSLKRATGYLRRLFVSMKTDEPYPVLVKNRPPRSIGEWLFVFIPQAAVFVCVLVCLAVILHSGGHPTYILRLLPLAALNIFSMILLTKKVR